MKRIALLGLPIFLLSAKFGSGYPEAMQAVKARERRVTKHLTIARPRPDMRQT